MAGTFKIVAMYNFSSNTYLNMDDKTNAYDLEN